MKLHQLLFWILLALLPAQPGFHFWPQWAMVLGRRVDYLAPTIFLTDILIFLTLTSWIFSEKLKIKNQISKIKSKNKKFKIFFLVLAFVSINILVSTDKPVSTYKWLKVAEFVSLGWYIVKTKPSFKFIATPLSISVLYSSVIAISQFFLQHSIGGPLWWLGERTFTIDTPGIARTAIFGRELLRPYATFPHPNVLGGFLATLLPLMIFNKIVFALGLITLFLTFSRSAIVVGLAAILYVFFKKSKFFIFLILLPLTFYLLPPLQDESIVVRQQLNDVSVKLWQQSPLFGIGLGNFLVKLPESLPSRSVYFLQPAHNVYLLLLSEIGIVGFLFVTWIIKQAVSVKREAFRRNDNKKLYTLRYTLYALLILSFVDHYPLTLQQGQLLFTLFLSMNLASRKVK